MIKTHEPKTPIRFMINKKHVVNGKRNNACECVIAQALNDRFDTELLEAHVRATNTVLLFSGGRQEKYQTPSLLREALNEFDKSGKWILPLEKEVSLEPLCKSQRRKYVADRAKKRRESGDKHMNTKYEANGTKRPRKMSLRTINLVALRKSTTH